MKNMLRRSKASTRKCKVNVFPSLSAPTRCHAGSGTCVVCDFWVCLIFRIPEGEERESLEV